MVASGRPGSTPCLSTRCALAACNSRIGYEDSWFNNRCMKGTIHICIYTLDGLYPESCANISQTRKAKNEYYCHSARFAVCFSLVCVCRVPQPTRHRLKYLTSLYEWRAHV